MNLIEYVRAEGLLRFSEHAFNEVDAVILAQIAYLDFDYLYSRAVHSIADITNDAMMRRATRATWNPQGNLDLLRELKRSVRFGSLEWSEYKNHLDPNKEQQFTAITLHMGDNQYYLSYRGTSAALVDWKEDLNMTFLDAIPSQLSALKYFEHIAQFYGGESSYYLGGHSKGGNLAVYAAVNAPKHLQKAIREIYSVDGPGIKQALPEAIAPKVHKLIPESSVVGLLLEPDKAYTVVKSNGFGIDQHDPFTWAVEDRQFLRVGSISAFSQFTESSVSRWLEQVDDATKQEFLSSLFAVFASAQFKDLDDVTKDVPATLRFIERSVRGMTPASQRQWRAVTDAFVKSVVTEARSRIDERGSAFFGSVSGAVGGVVQRSLDSVKSVKIPLPNFARDENADSSEKTVE